MSAKNDERNVKNSARKKSSARQPQARSLETRRLLLEAARTIFVRDGYERAQIDAIAAAAGRTKGAVYGHFKDKEDLFLALFEERSKKEMESVAARMSAEMDQAANLQVLRDFYRSQAADKPWAILTLEFKLYALRYPEVRRRLRQAYRQTRPQNLGLLVQQTFGIKVTDARLTMEGAMAALSPILCGMVLESLLEPEHFPVTRLPAYLEALFDGLIQPEKAHSEEVVPHPQKIDPKKGIRSGRQAKSGA
ncbi:MAG TPA: TetR/AcrR family transcriptional regulator [Acidobacteriaceae bacterium]|nr:TetR/AcrR family transcriptional regulator [Acidobacteriaceae bacterium]